ncbi:MAG: 50S ribosomal protein L21 [Candidatus Buchananbacteria bacterium RIFCSPHIGHO2_01_FULL_44_11]|uniref:Large ribosomal subunit protein bL21 n=1 Tax=Candidatus Buchananbacteria bacterium RIFCSPHIGHO2_01_FULL_44_11 TaxID=1797535 RepID=A0A1G1Y4D9_9BACT|nr:MAG: 50S ribosomal protein L21 [Candidatus Buchananbacteria bacterium RIFCSPHIGHO2_01_FULL_44_11]
MSLAVIKTGGKQYLVKPGDKIKIEKLTGQVGDMVKFDTMLTTDETGQKIEIGKPFLKTQVTGKILKQARADKVMVIKFKSKVRYRRKVGHRQHYTQVQIESI